MLIIILSIRFCLADLLNDETYNFLTDDILKTDHIITLTNKTLKMLIYMYNNLDKKFLEVIVAQE